MEAQNTTSTSININEAGTLKVIIENESKKKSPHLIILGKINAKDINYLESLGKETLSVLDLTDAQIVYEGEGKDVACYSHYVTNENNTTYRRYYYNNKNNYLSTYSFYEASNLTILILPKSLTEIGAHAFPYGSSSKLKEVHFRENTPPKIDYEGSGGDFIRLFRQVKIYIPTGSSSAYENEESWKGSWRQHSERIFEEDYSPTSNEKNISNSIKVEYIDDGLRIYTDTERMFYIFSINGKLMKQLKICGNEQIQLSPSIYIITSEGFSKKVVTK